MAGTKQASMQALCSATSLVRMPPAPPQRPMMAHAAPGRVVHIHQQDSRPHRRGRCAVIGAAQAPAASETANSPADVRSPGNREAPAESTTDAAAAEAAYANFDWRAQWYPVAFVRDMPEGKLAQVTLFDEQYAVVRRPAAQGGPAAVADRCPHRAAALSQGLLTPEGHIQCAYHGWKFDGGSGDCVDIPQLQPGAKFSRRTCTAAFPCVEHQGLLWLKPQPGSLDAGFSTDKLAGVPELDRDGWITNDFVRDFDVDYTLLLENLHDPDHGLFAHQAPYFDMFSGSTDMMMRVEAGSTRHGAPTITGRVPAVLKLTQEPKAGKAHQRPPPTAQKPNAELTATIRFQAPVHVRWSRFDKDGNTKAFTAFYVAPTGAGRCRFLLRYCRLAPAWQQLPNWVFAIMMNKFLDQDTYLLATQQPYTLTAEAQGSAEAQHRSGSSGSGVRDGNGSDPTASSSNGSSGDSTAEPAGDASAGEQQEFPGRRKSMFCYKAPSDSLQIQLGRWIDGAVPQMPNRAQNLLGALNAGTLMHQDPREMVLDRWTGHTQVCPDSMTAVRTMQRLRAICSGAAALGAAAFVFHLVTGGSWTASLWGGVIATAASAAVAVAAEMLERQFSYCYTRERQERELARIPKLTVHLQRSGGATQPAANRGH